MLVVSGLYWNVLSHDFVNYDDTDYVTGNSMVRSGFHLEGVVRAFRSTQASNWHPVTWLSHMLDVELFGLNPAGHHLTNLLFHCANAILLYFLLYRTTAGIGRSLCVALLFAVHPLHVESVAWVAERKDLLSTFFGLLAMLAYVRYVREPGRGRYLTVLILFIIGLMAKPMLVTLPIMLILLDFWPLRRLNPQPASAPAIPLQRLFTEKTPLFILSSLSCVITFFVQQKGGATVPLEESSLQLNAGNALISYAGYLLKMFWPARLAVFYPFDAAAVTPWRVAGASLLLVVITYLAFRSARRYPYFLFGWLWFLATLIPVIGVVRVGDHAMADRYTYIPLIGLFVAIVWGGADLCAGSRLRKATLAICTLSALTTLSIITWLQIGCWRNSIALFEQALAVSGDTWLAHNNLGLALKRQGQFEKALSHYFEALRIRPDVAVTYNNIGNVYRIRGQRELALEFLSRAIRMKPDYGDAHFNLALMYQNMGRRDMALSECTILEGINAEDARELHAILD